MKKIRFLTLLTLALMSSAGAWAEVIASSNLVWTYSDGTLTFSKGSGSGDAVIPDIDYSSTDHWRAYAGDVTSVVIGDGITTIGEYAFYDFVELKTVSIGKNVQTIGAYAFSYCGAMETITLPASLTKICEDAFECCEALKSINIPDAVTDIGNLAFLGCNKMEEVTIGNNVANIGNYAFQNCTALMTVYMKPAAPPTLGNDIFNGCGGKPIWIIVPDESAGTYQNADGFKDWKYKIVGEIAALWNSDGTRNGTAEHPYLITTTMGLDLLASKVNSGTEYGRDDTHLNGYYFELGSDIAYSYTTDCDKATSTENNYTAIGYCDGSKDNYFKGHFDGRGHTVKGIRIYKSGDGNVDGRQGLFGLIGEDGSVSHVTLDDARITGYDYVGGIAGAKSGGTITDCHVTEKVYIHAVKDEAYYHGGIVGANYKNKKDAIVSGCTSRAHITLGSNASDCSIFGGIAGINYQGTIQDCLYLGGEIGGNERVGAIAGYNEEGTIENCYYTESDFTGKDLGGKDVTLSNGNPAIGDRAGEVTETNNAYARTITLEGDVAIGGTANDYAKAGTTPMVHLTTYTPSGGNAPTAMKYATADGKAWLFAQSDAELSLGYDGTTSEGYLAEEKATKTDGGSDVTSTIYTGGKLTVPEYDVTFSATAEDVWGVSGDEPNDGSETKPYTITSPGGFKLLAKQVNEIHKDYAGKYFALGGDVEFEHKAATDPDAETENNYTAIGCYISDLEDYYFKGHFDGCSHTVSGIRIYKGSNGYVDCSQGLFGQIGAGGSVSHVTLNDARITGYGYVGGIVGYNKDGTITDCHVTENVYIHAVKDGAKWHGGIVGFNEKINNGGIVSGCTSRAHITLSSTASDCRYYGGIVGFNVEGTIQDCLYLGGEVGGNSDVGAIAGYNYVGTIENCYFKTLTDDSGNGNVMAMDENYTAIGYSYGKVTETNNAYARTITLEGDVAIGGTANDYAKAGTTPMVHLTTYTPSGGTAPTAMKYATTDGKAWLFAPSGTKLSLGYDGTTGEGYLVEEKATKTDGGSDLPSTVYTDGTLTVPEYDVTFSATGEDVWGVSGNEPNDGSETKPYTITSPGGFKLLAKQVNSGANEYSGTYFALGGDVEFEHKAADEEGAETENNYTAIGYFDGTNVPYFKGHFDGCGHTVKGIRIYKGSDGDVDCSQGLFGRIGESGSVSHLTLDDARITGHLGVGGIVGRNKDGTITDCHVTENVYIHAVKDEAYYHGGIVGYNIKDNKDAIVSGCTSRAHITIVSTASDCHNYGGIAGYNIWGTIQDCLYLGGQVGGNNYVGAIAGYNSEGTIENCYFKTLTDDSGNGNVMAMDENYTAIGYSYGEVTETNNAYARTITLGEGVTLGGTTTDYAKDVVNPTQYLTAYATDGTGFALAHTTVGTETTTALYSVKDATVSVKPSGQLDDGITPTFIVTKSQGGTVEVSSDNSVYTFLMPADDVSVSMLTGVKVKVGAQSFATYCSSQAVSLGSGQTDCALYTLSDVSSTAVTLSEISGAASKETPLLVWNGSDSDQDILLSFAPAPNETTEHAKEFVGTLAATDVTTLTNATVYVLYNNMFMRATTGSIPANRAYIALPAGSNARALSIGTVTGITPPLTPPLKGAGNGADGRSSKLNGAGAVYDMQGRKVSDGDAVKNLRKGVYIQDGRKRVVR